MRSSVSVSTAESASSRDQDFRIAQDRARQGGALLLSAGEGDAALADHGFVARWEFGDFRRDAGGLRRIFDGVVCRGVHAKGDVLAHGLAEQIGILRHEADGPAQFGQGPVADGASIDQKRILAVPPRAARPAPRACSCRCRLVRRSPAVEPAECRG